ncbi:MAG: alginate export family protein [Bdellovibrionales bacterium]|nr:alginate export family protein [Bdellovibrionales bacterium]
MKKLTAILASVAFIGSAYAADSEVSQNAEFRLRYKYDQNADRTDSGSKDAWYSRVKWGSTFRAGEKFTGHLAVLHNSTFGVSGVAGDMHTALPSAELNTENALLVQSAYVNWMISNDLMLKVGRMPIVIGDERVMGENDYLANPYAFEGFGLGYESEFAHVGFYGLKLADFSWNSMNDNLVRPNDGGATDTDNAASSSAKDPERNLYIVNVDFKSLPEFLNMANLHIIADNQSEVNNLGTADSNYSKREVTRYGVAIGGEAAGVDYRVTYEAVGGTTEDNTTETDVESNMMDIELGYSFDWMASRVHVLHHTDSGTGTGSTKNETYDGFFYEKHYNAGLMDLFGWGNLTYSTLGYTMNPSDKSEYGLGYTMFTRTEKASSVSNLMGSSYTLVNDEDDLGSEIDLYAKYKYDGGLDILTRVGMFTPGAAFTDLTPKQDENHMQFFVQARWKF